LFNSLAKPLSGDFGLGSRMLTYSKLLK
jgi:hypothetical protein